MIDRTPGLSIGGGFPSSPCALARTYRCGRRAKALEISSSPLGWGDIWDRHSRPELIPAFDRRTNGSAPAEPFVPFRPGEATPSGSLWADPWIYLRRSWRAQMPLIPGLGQVRVFILTARLTEPHLVLADQMGRPSALPPREDSPHRVCKPLVAGTQTRRRGASSRPAGRGALSGLVSADQRRRAATGTRVRTITRSGSCSRTPRSEAMAAINARGVRSRRGSGVVGRSTTAARASSGSAMDERGRMRIGSMG